MSRTFRKTKSAYLAEFLIIIAGITVSFILNEWREGKKLETKKEQLLLDINKDLFADSMVFHGTINIYKTMARSHDTLLNYRTGTLNPDTLTAFLDHFTSYMPFNATPNTYKRINADPEMTIERKDSLIWYYMNLHNIVYPRIQEWFFVEKDFVLNTALPYMDQHAPFIYPTPVNYSFQGEVFYDLRKEDEFMNYLKSGRTYKKNMVRILQFSFDYLKNIKKQVRAQTNIIREEK